MLEKSRILLDKSYLLDHFLENFVQTQNYPATIKDSKSGRYISCNKHVASLAGLKPEEYIGLTAYDIREITQGKQEFTENAVAMDRRIITSTEPFIKYKHVWFTKKNSIFIEEVIKQPILNYNNNIIAILAYGRDITLYTPLPYLFSLYEEHLPSKKAIKYFLEHINLPHVFHELPTRKELIVLLSMCKTTNIQYIARELGITPRTIEENKARLRNKLKIIGLNELVIQLRIRHEYNTTNK